MVLGTLIYSLIKIIIASLYQCLHTLYLYINIYHFIYGLIQYLSNDINLKKYKINHFSEVFLFMIASFA